MYERQKDQESISLGMAQGGQLARYNPQDLAQLAFDALPPRRQTRPNLEALMERADRGPNIIEATILEDTDLSKRPELLDYLKEMKINVTHNHYYSQPSLPVHHNPSLYANYPPPNYPIASHQPVYFEPPQLNFRPQVEVKPVIHVHVDPTISTKAGSRSESRSEGGDWDGSFAIFITAIACLFVVASVSGSD